MLTEQEQSILLNKGAHVELRGNHIIITTSHKFTKEQEDVLLAYGWDKDTTISKTNTVYYRKVNQ